jgi:hypothetical protein
MSAHIGTPANVAGEFTVSAIASPVMAEIVTSLAIALAGTPIQLTTRTRTRNVIVAGWARSQRSHLAVCDDTLANRFHVASGTLDRRPVEQIPISAIRRISL